MFIRSLFIAVLLALLTGCSAGGKQFAGIEAPATGFAKVYIYRPSAFIQSGIYPDIELDSKLVGKLKNGGFLALQVSPGEHTLAITGNYLQWSHPNRSFPLTFEAGKTYYYKLQPFVSGGGVVGGVYLANHGYSFAQITDEEIAVSELSKLHESMK